MMMGGVVEHDVQHEEHFSFAHPLLEALEVAKVPETRSTTR